jgi:hypothetical protein
MQCGKEMNGIAKKAKVHDDYLSGVVCLAVEIDEVNRHQRRAVNRKCGF